MTELAEIQLDSKEQQALSESASGRARFLKLVDVAVLLASLIIFFLFLNVLVRIVFPQGASLAEVAAVDGATVVTSGDRGAIDIASNAGGFGYFEAFLGDIRRDVKIRPANSIAWASARKGSEVHDRDAVQTFSNSRARVDFASENRLAIGQNSLVVFSNGAADPFLARREAAVVVLDGELTGEIGADYGAFGIEFPAGLVELTADEESADAVNFRVSVNPDQSSTLMVYSGIADVNVAGEHYKVTASRGITIAKDGTTTGVAGLLTMPLVYQPASNNIARFLNLPPRVTFSWGRVSGAQQYRLEIASDADFEEIVVDETLSGNSFVHGNLAAGEYFWRVSALVGWAQSPATLARRLSVVRDAAPPMLDLMPIERLTANAYVLRGNTTQRAKVYVSGERVTTTPDGHFEYQFNPEPGTHAIVIESVDDVGNSAYSSQLLHVPGEVGRSN